MITGVVLCRIMNVVILAVTVNMFNISFVRQMVFADREVTISGGNFHGEYPAKVQSSTFRAHL